MTKNKNDRLSEGFLYYLLTESIKSDIILISNNYFIQMTKRERKVIKMLDVLSIQYSK